MKILKNNILLLFLLTLTNCPLGLPSIPAEHLYLWESTEDKDILFVLSHGEQTYNPATQSITQYIDQQEPLSMNSVFIYDEYNIKNKIKSCVSVSHLLAGIGWRCARTYRLKPGTGWLAHRDSTTLKQNLVKFVSLFVFRVPTNIE